MELFRSPIIFKRPEKPEQRRKTAVVPAGRSVGTSFTAVQMALYDGRANIIELGKPYFYAAYGMEKRFADRPFVFFEDDNPGCRLSSIRNVEFGINWLLRRENSGPMSESVLMKAVSLPPAGNSYFDFSDVGRDLILSCLSEMDEIFLVVDPLPTKLLEGAQFMEKLMLMFPETTIIVNKMNPGVHRNELKRFLGHSKIKEIPFYPPEEIYRSEYNCCPPMFT